MTTPMTGCAAALERLDALRRGELAAEDADALRHHLAACPQCRCVERYEAAFLERIRAAGTGCCCPDQLREAVRKRCHGEPCDE